MNTYLNKSISRVQICPTNTKFRLDEIELKYKHCLCQASRWPLNWWSLSLKTLSSLVVLWFSLQSMWLSDLISRQLPLAHSYLQTWVKMWVLIKEHLLSFGLHSILFGHWSVFQRLSEASFKRDEMFESGTNRVPVSTRSSKPHRIVGPTEEHTK